MTDLDDTRCAYCGAALRGLGWPMVGRTGTVYRVHADERECLEAYRAERQQPTTTLLKEQEHGC